MLRRRSGEESADIEGRRGWLGTARTVGGEGGISSSSAGERVSSAYLEFRLETNAVHLLDWINWRGSATRCSGR